MKIIKNFCCFVLSATVCLSLICTTVSAACYMTGYQTDSTSGWTLYSTHRGSIVSDYKFFNSEIKNRYSSDMKTSIAMWGSHISMEETSVSGYGTITVVNDQSSGAYATTYPYGDGYGHTGENYKIAINQANYDDAYPSIKKVVLAHEIGHVYGLNHYNDRSKIMNPEALSFMTISDSEFAGIDACTHRDSHTSFTYVGYSGSYHIARCTHCKAYTYQAHYYSSSSNACVKCGYPYRSAMGIDDCEDYDEQNNDNVEVDNVPQVEFEYEDEMTNLYGTPFVNDEN